MATALCFARCDARALRHDGLHSQPVDEGRKCNSNADIVSSRHSTESRPGGDHESPISREMLAEVPLAVLSFRPLRGRRRPGYPAGSPWRRAMLPSPVFGDTSAAAAEIQRQQIRHLSPLERLRKGCALSNRGRRLAMEAIRRRYPAANDAEVRLRFIELAYGPSLAREVRCWLDRPAS